MFAVLRRGCVPQEPSSLQVWLLWLSWSKWICWPPLMCCRRPSRQGRHVPAARRPSLSHPHSTAMARARKSVVLNRHCPPSQRRHPRRGLVHLLLRLADFQRHRRPSVLGHVTTGNASSRCATSSGIAARGSVSSTSSITIA